ncbi:MAG TPA: exopolysaccharide biosynthesis polyprenyl glycosylphosphotransferase [Flavipsychrobacter sp.]|nr:exopolysaccharide biosynthesis polyprenyl glycosylphosphotransferase [Flavipsychrobacter sp.]
MSTKSLFYIKAFVLCLDFAIVNISFGAGMLWMQLLRTHMLDISSTPIHQKPYWLFFNFCWLIAALLYRAYHAENILNLENNYRITWRIWVAQSILFCTGLLVLNDYLIDYRLCLSVLLSYMFLLVVGKIVYTYLFYRLARMRPLRKRMTVIGQNAHAVSLERAFTKSYPFLSTEVVDNITWNFDENKVLEVDCFLEQFKKMEQGGVHEAIISVPCQHLSHVSQIQRLADNYSIHVAFVPAFEVEKLDWSVTIDGGVPIFQMRQSLLNNAFYSYRKRLFDIVFSSFIIVFVLSWLVPIIGLIIKIQSPGPIFFKQLRSGRNNVPFYCYKFRSMRKDNPNEAKQASKDDPRVTRIGKWIRKTSIDEFPQFINVFLGDMSVVGPRPHMTSHTFQYRTLIDAFMVRHGVKPGITGWAQVNGYRGETKDPQMMKKRVDYDIFYLDNWNFMMDIKIVILTFLNMTQGEKNAY